MTNLPDDIELARLGLLALTWLAYFALHSLLASLGLKRWVARERPGWMRVYRLAYNAMALLLLVPPLWLTYSERGPWLWEWTGFGWWLANGLAALAALGFLWSLRWYDGAEFLGLRQWREGVRTAEDQERFHLSPLHRYVRHPWYSLGLVIVWTRDMDLAFLVTAMMITLYFVAGSRLEERKLLVYHGEAYRRYRRLVPSLVPSPWKFLSREQAHRLIAQAPGDLEGE
jgi:protein-S-isoprenylcysteine O-methyltransferase Ste14